MALVHLWDSAVSAMAGAASLAICGVPSWFTFRAIQGGLAPTWAYGFVAVLAGVGVILAAAFGRKAIEGVGPGRDRRR